jgi:glucose-6-phosphate isomerase
MREPGICRVDVAKGVLDGASNRYEKAFRDLAGLYEDEPAFSALLAERAMPSPME